MPYLPLAEKESATLALLLTDSHTSNIVTQGLQARRRGFQPLFIAEDAGPRHPLLRHKLAISQTRYRGQDIPTIKAD